jgi:hypothetical protein
VGLGVVRGVVRVDLHVAIRQAAALSQLLQAPPRALGVPAPAARGLAVITTDVSVCGRGSLAYAVTREGASLGYDEGTTRIRV